MSDKSDYKKPRIKLHQLLPEVFHSDTSEALFENLFNRFLTKSESKRVAGYVGKGNKNAITKRQIQEPTLHRQAFQLQPILYDKIGSVEHISSWEDILLELQRLGIDVDRLPQWGDMQQFTWAPPIDIDKLINYRDYYWYDEENPNSKPEYITIRSRCSTAISNVNFWQGLIQDFGSLIPIKKYERVDRTLPTYDLVSIDETTKTITVVGDATDEYHVGDIFSISGTANNDGHYKIASTPTFDVVTLQTTIEVTQTLVAESNVSGTISIEKYNKLVLDGEYTRLFGPGFVLFIKNTSNAELGGSFWTVEESSYDEFTNETTVKLNVEFTDTTLPADISLEEKLNILLAQRDCQCSSTIGWDLFQWDDNPSDPLWGGAPPGDHSNLLAAISHSGPPSSSPSGEPLWFDTVDDKLYHYDSASSSWKLIYNNFSLIVNDTKGTALWDLTPDCGIQSKVPAADQWIKANKWLHKSDVPNFSIAKQAAIPIIEYDWDLELNEWTYTKHKWSYRKDRFSPWTETTDSPSVIELTPIEYWTYDSIKNEIIIDERYGDLTTWFRNDEPFQAISVPAILYVDYSYYASDSPGLPYKTHIRLKDPIPAGLTPGNPSPTPLRPHRTSKGDPWKNYNEHWLYLGVEGVYPIPHQTANPFIEVDISHSTLDPSGDFEYATSYYGQYYSIRALTLNILPLDTSTKPGTYRPLTQRAVVGFDDIRVYVNGIRQYGTYQELTEVELKQELGLVPSPTDDDTFVAAIKFTTGNEIHQFDEVLIEVGEATIEEFGNYAVPVRTIADDIQFSVAGPEIRSVISHRKSEQVKTRKNQYPLFDIYKVDGTPTLTSNAIFGYQTSETENVHQAVGQRIVYEKDTLNYYFDQFLLNEDNGELLAYRDYANRDSDFWFDTETKTLWFWTGLSWSRTNPTSTHNLPAAVSDVEPTGVYQDFSDVYWFDTANNQLKYRLTSGDPWVVLDGVTISSYDHTLQTIWKRGLNNEKYVPEKVDWDGRTYDQYIEEQNTYVTQLAEELIKKDSTLTWDQAIAQAETEWYQSQSNIHSPSGHWIGDWEIPDPLYYNHNHDNHKIITTRELLTHFGSIIDAQPKLPGFNGKSEYMFHLIPTNDVNYGLGARIKEYNVGFDTFISSIYVNNVTPIGLLEFAHNQYQSLLNNLREIFRLNIIEILTTPTPESLTQLDVVVNQTVKTIHEQNDNFALLYGDSTTFTEVDGINDLGVRNWIATLPYFSLISGVKPVQLIDDALNIREIRHHDGHTWEYDLSQTIVEDLIIEVIDTSDPRTRFPGPDDPPIDTFGRRSTTSLPPNTISEFEAIFPTTIENREGVFWYYDTPSQQTLYRLNVANIGTEEPSTILPDGSLWLDLTPNNEILRVKQTDPITGVSDWVPVPGLTIGDGRLHNGTDPNDVTTATISAWQRVDINSLLRGSIENVENLLFENVPNDNQNVLFNIDDIIESDVATFESKLQECFSDYVAKNKIVDPFKNYQYDPSDAFTWNYKYSISGSGFTILQADAHTNSFTVSGDQTAIFNPCGSTIPCTLQTTFYVKNSNGNDGTWKTKQAIVHPSAIYDPVSDTTKIFVEGNVVDSSAGVLYTGLLPSSSNTGGESGGYWKDLYDKLYHTPYPHLEPWKLQGYSSKPSWWDEEYLNDDIDTWGDRRWKYKHGFEIIAVDPTANTLTIKGDFSNVFVVGNTFTVNKSSYLDGLYHIVSVNYDTASNTLTISVSEDITTSVADGRIAIAYGMWENIRRGVVPPGREYSNGITSITGNPTEDSNLYRLPTPEIPTYNYFSVNIDNLSVSSDGGVTNYSPDDVFPPYWDYTAAYGISPDPMDRVIRSVFSIYNTEIVSPSQDYVYGDSGPVEWQWKTSAQYLYDRLKAAFQTDPITYVTSTFGVQYGTVNGLYYDKRTNNTFSHIRTVFHGEIVDNQLVQVNGTNQWYVNYNRYAGYDGSFSDFRSMWTEWRAPLTYQLAAFIDTQSLQIAHRYVDVTEFDYDITTKKSKGVKDFWIDAFDVSITNIPPKIVRFDNQHQWEFQVDTNLTIGREVSVYDVHQYPFTVDVTNNICRVYTYNISNVDVFNNAVVIRYDQTNVFKSGDRVEIIQSTSNDGTYTIVSATYNSVSNTTLLVLEEELASGTVDGLIRSNYRTLPWETGQQVLFTSEQTPPSPLSSNKFYFVIVLSDTEFQLAYTRDDAINGQPIILTSTGDHNLAVGQATTSFTALDGATTSNTWYHYLIDKQHVKSVQLPTKIKGISNLINFVDGYEQYQADQGWKINANNNIFDQEYPARMASWQLELEKFIDFAYQVQKTVVSRQDTFSVAVDVTTNTWTFEDSIPPRFVTGDKVVVLSSGSLPDPLMPQMTYYIIRDSVETFRLAMSQYDATIGNEIDITTTGTDVKIAAAPQTRDSIAHKEINPFRGGVWFETKQGIVSNIIKGPSDDIRTTYLLFDNQGNPITEDNYRIYRSDTEVQISIPDTQTTHLGGVHLFVNEYEHVIKFNDYTTEGQLIYDPFVGLNATKFELLFDRQIEFTKRPAVGGQYLHNENAQNLTLKRNIEASIDDLRYLFDTNTVNESNTFVDQSRQLLGYEGTRSYLDDINVNRKSQFLFWKGQIQTKGSMNAVKAFINSRRFIDAKIDEYWAVKLAEFGSSKEKEYPELWLKSSDTRSNDLRLMFLNEDDYCTPGYSKEAYDNDCGYAFPDGNELVFRMDGYPGFIPIILSDDTRWHNQPDQMRLLRNNGLSLYFDMVPIGNIPIINAGEQEFPTYPTSPKDGDGIIIKEPISPWMFKRWNEKTQQWEVHGTWNVGDLPILRHNFKADLIEITLDWNPDGTHESFTVGSPGYPAGKVITLQNYTYIPFTGGIEVFKNGVKLENVTEFTETAPVSGNVYADTIIFATDLVNGDVIDVVFKTSKLIEDTHYQVVNSNIIQLLSSDLLNPTITNFKLWGLLGNIDAQNPARIIDVKTNTSISAVQVWDPARNRHYQTSMSIIDIQTDSDPAIYTNSPVDQTNNCSTSPEFCVEQPGPWGRELVGTTWLDTTNLDYITYYDSKTFNDVEEQLRSWGQLADWGNITIKQWVESDVPPDQWNDIATREEGDSAIPEQVRKSGRVYKTLFEYNGSEWVELRDIKETFDVSFEGQLLGPGTYRLYLANIQIGEVVSIYRNGKFVEQTTVDPAGYVDVIAEFQDRITVINHRVTDDPATIAANVDAGIWKHEYKHTTETYYDELGNQRVKYYFWVENKKTKSSNQVISPHDAVSGLREIPAPYMFYQHPLHETSLTIDGDIYHLPARYNQLIVRGLRGLVDGDNRYVLRFTRDFTLRDTLETQGTSFLDPKSLHEQWLIFRQEQPYHIERFLWDKVTEAMIGHKLDDPTVKIPSYERELYDEKYNTTTRFGLGEDQAFVDGDTAKSTIVAYLLDPTNDFYPTDINTFFARHSFDTEQEIIDAMDTIYNTFAYVHVNRMFFSVLHDALANKTEYADLFKTSMIALHGIRPFQISGIFDD